MALIFRLDVMIGVRTGLYARITGKDHILRMTYKYTYFSKLLNLVLNL